MTLVLAATGAGTFVVLAAWHFYWALGGHVGLHAAIPQVQGRPAFKPRRWMTATVGLALLACAALLLRLGGAISLWVVGPAGTSPGLLIALGYGLAIGLLLRALGDGRRVGLLKRKAGPDAFARLDAWVYSPLCLALSLATVIVVAGAH